MLTFALEEIVEQLRSGSFELDCLDMTLQERTSDATPISGAGNFSVASDGTLQVKMYARGAPPPLPQLPAGELIPRDSLYCLRATDLRRRQWTCDFLFPDKCDFSGSDSVIRATIMDLKHVEDYGAIPGDEVDLFAFGDLRVPVNAATETKITSNDSETTSSNMDRAVVKMPTCRLDFHNAPGLLRATVDAEVLSEQTDDRLAEALQFILASPVHWSVLHRSGRGRQITSIRLRERMLARPRMHKPIQFLGSHDFTGSVWPLFQRYYEFVSGANVDEWHPISIHLYNAGQASAGSLDSQRVALGVAVEGIVASAFPEISERTSEDAIKSIRDHVETWPGLPDWPGREAFRERIRGLFGLLGRASAKDRMHALARRGLIESDDIKAWSRLRNYAVHPETVDPGVTRESLALIERVTTLMYKVVFARIGYEGAYTDYGAPGWPKRLFAIPSTGPTT